MTRGHRNTAADTIRKATIIKILQANRQKQTRFTFKRQLEKRRKISENISNIAFNLTSFNNIIYNSFYSYFMQILVTG